MLVPSSGPRTTARAQLTAIIAFVLPEIAAQKGVSLYKIASWMGHTMIEVTEMYAHLAAYDPDINRLNPVATPPIRPHLRIVK